MNKVLKLQKRGSNSLKKGGLYKFQTPKEKGGHKSLNIEFFKNFPGLHPGPLLEVLNNEFFILTLLLNLRIC